MTTTHSYIRFGMNAVRPYLYGHPDLLDFVKQVFRAKELERTPIGKGLHVEIKIDDSMLVLELGVQSEMATRSSIYVYVDNVDTVYTRALQAGAMALSEPEDKPYQERVAGIRDTFGNIWWIATYTGSDA